MLIDRYTFIFSL